MFKVDNRLFESAWDVAEYIAENEIDDRAYDDMLDECHEVVEIGCMTFYPSDILKNCDPIAYDLGWDDYKDSVTRDIEYDLDRMEDGDVEDVWGYEVECIEEEEEQAAA